MNYDALEKMKDGEAFASKYDSQQLKIWVPNVVMLFSNYPPAFSELENFYVEDNQLQKKSLARHKDQKKKKDKVNTDSESQISDFLLFLIQNWL